MPSKSPTASPTDSAHSDDVTFPEPDSRTRPMLTAPSPVDICIPNSPMEITQEESLVYFNMYSCVSFTSIFYLFSNTNAQDSPLLELYLGFGYDLSHFKITFALK